MNQKMERGRVPEHLGFTLSKEVLDLRWGWTPVAEVGRPLSTGWTE